ncbi:MAG: hypothetical protein LUH51_06675, partial [Firmicutes bacterium]|nr:hypothetical protein [Bacillota bacterium]
LLVELLSDNVTRKLYPFDFKVRLQFSIRNGTLAINQVYENTGEKRMPFAFGFHPYWLVQDPETAAVETLELGGGASKFLTLSFPEGQEQGAVSVDNAAEYAILDVGGGKRVRCRFDSSFTRLTVWSVKNKGFICIEPINSSPNGIATGDCYYLECRESKTAFVSFDVV